MMIIMLCSWGRAIFLPSVTHCFYILNYAPCKYLSKSIITHHIQWQALPPLLNWSEGKMGSQAWGMGAKHGGWEPSMGGGSPAWGGVASIDIRPSQIMLGNLAKFLFSDSLIMLIYCTHYSNIILFHRSSPIFFKLS